MSIDPNVVATGVISDLCKDLFKSVSGYTTHKIATKWEKFFPNFQAHLTEVHKRSTSVKILCAYDTPVDFKSLFVPPLLKGANNSKTTDQDILEALRNNGRIVINSQGGSGKTFLTKHLWIKLFEEPQGQVPILIELRGLNGSTSLDLMTYIRATAFKAGGITAENFVEFCEDGAFVFILDGFDEIDREHRAELEKQVLGLSDKFLHCSIAVTGRPDDRFGSWKSFSLYECLPFDYRQFREQILKVPFDDVSKRNFLKVADEPFFGLHVDFLSNPLLSMMMLMTYQDNAEIPKKLSVFYENCFFTLFTRHDAMKEQYSRKKVFDQGEFRRLFSVFSFFSYLKTKPQMDEGEIREFIQKSIDYTKIDTSVDEVIVEFLETVNLIQKDGTKFMFIHRSFQEYFAAHCATNEMSERSDKIIPIFAERRFDSTFLLAFQMNPNLVFVKFLIPSYSKLRDEGVMLTEKVKTKPYDTLHACGFNFSIHLDEKQKPSAGFGVSWAMHRELSILDWCFSRILEVKNISECSHDQIFRFHRGFSKRISSKKLPKLADKLFGRLEIRFEPNELVLDRELSIEYKRDPKVLTIVEQIFREEMKKISVPLNELHRERFSSITQELERQILRIEENDCKLALEFGL